MTTVYDVALHQFQILQSEIDCSAIVKELIVYDQKIEG